MNKTILIHLTEISLVGGCGVPESEPGFEGPTTRLVLRPILPAVLYVLTLRYLALIVLPAKHPGQRKGRAGSFRAK